MNIFWLSKNAERCAQYHCDKHVVKMCVEYAQIMSTVVRLTRGVPVQGTKRVHNLMSGERLVGDRIVNRHPHVYLMTHANHPCVVWARESRSNWLAVRTLGLALCAEYTRRYGKMHSCEELIRKMPRPKLKDLGMTRPPLTMPDEYKRGSVVASYRNFYIKSKSRFATWKHTKVPHWYARALED